VFAQKHQPRRPSQYPSRIGLVIAARWASVFDSQYGCPEASCEGLIFLWLTLETRRKQR
jgi:hypothetical protein